jgi:hypothetical protein
MRGKLLYILLLCTLIAGCSSKNNFFTRLNLIPSIQSQAQLPANGLRVINSQISVRRGGTGFITVQGTAGVKYTINTTYKMGGRTYHVAQWRLAGADGQVTFNWVCEPETSPGTYPITIFGGGGTLTTTHTVLP